MKRFFTCLTFVLLVFTLGLPAQENEQKAEYPVLESLETKKANTLFQQFLSSVENSNKLLFRMGAKDSFTAEDLEGLLMFYRYTPKDNEDLLRLSSRCALRYDTIATINRLESTKSSIIGKSLIIPTLNALFIPLDPKSTTEILLAKEFSPLLLSGKYPVCSIDGKKFYVMPDAKFSPTQRAFFLDPGMTLPLSKYVLSSDFGMRVSPISGKWKFHHGIDMAAPSGTDVYACKGGIVKYSVAMDPVYGNYVILDHGKGTTSLYAHLSSVLVKKNDSVSGGQIIGRVGTTGLSTGPHLHFEIRLNGESQDPQKYLQKS